MSANTKDKKREPKKCTRCLLHGKVSEKTKAHEKICRFRNCTNFLCSKIVTHKQKIMMMEQRIWRRFNKHINLPKRKKKDRKQICDKCRNHCIYNDKENHESKCEFRLCSGIVCQFSDARKKTMSFFLKIQRGNIRCEVFERNYRKVLEEKNTQDNKSTPKNGLHAGLPEHYKPRWSRDLRTSSMKQNISPDNCRKFQTSPSKLKRRWNRVTPPPLTNLSISDNYCKMSSEFGTENQSNPFKPLNRSTPYLRPRVISSSYQIHSLNDIPSPIISHRVLYPYNTHENKLYSHNRRAYHCDFHVHHNDPPSYDIQSVSKYNINISVDNNMKKIHEFVYNDQFFVDKEENSNAKAELQHLDQHKHPNPYTSYHRPWL